MRRLLSADRRFLSLVRRTCIYPEAAHDFSAIHLHGLLFRHGAVHPRVGDDEPFIEANPATVIGKREVSFQQWLGWSAGGTAASFSGFQSVREFDFGLSLAFDLAFAATERGFEQRLLAQKHVFAFENVLNIGFNNVWARDGAEWERTSALSVNCAIAFPPNEHWTVSFEANNQVGFDGLFPWRGVQESSNAHFIGPTIQYDCDLAVATFGIQAQPPWLSENASDGGYTPGAERFRALRRVFKTI